jgi:hypothetical protein
VTKDKNLSAMIDFLADRHIGVRIGQESSYVPSRYRRNRGYKRMPYKGYIEVPITIAHVLSTTPQAITNNVARNLAHEIGHWLVAPKGRRYRKDYGIKGDTLRWDLDEMKARIVEHFILQHFGFGDRIKILRDPIWRWRNSRSTQHRQMRREALRWWQAEGQAQVQKELGP